MVTYTRLLPPEQTGEKVTPADLLSLLAPDGEELPSDRPYTVANFVASADGRVAFDGRSGPLGDDGDKALFHSLREQVDAVLAGTVTLRTERYGRILGKAERRERRRAAGRAPEPIACVVSRSGEIPLEIPLFSDPEAHVVVFTRVEPDLTGVGARVDYIPLDSRDERPLTTAMATLRGRFGVETLLCEGGPTLFGALLGEHLVDELFLTIAPKLAGGVSGPTVTAGRPLPELTPLEIRSLLTRDDVLYLRYRVSRAFTSGMGQST